MIVFADEREVSPDVLHRSWGNDNSTAAIRLRPQIPECESA